MRMRSFALPLLLVLAACGGQDVQGQQPLPLQSPPAASPSPTAAARPGVPPEFWAACGKPGSSVEVKRVPVTVRHADCDLTGVYLSYGDVGGVRVLKPGTGVTGFFHAAEGATGGSVSAGRDAKTKDVTFTADSHGP